MKKKIIKIAFLLFFILLILCYTSNVKVNASNESTATDSSNGIQNQFALDPFFNVVNPVNELTNNTAATVIGVVRVVCVTIAIVMLLVIAMKYMISAPGDRADIKKHAIAYVIGAMILFGSYAILGILVNIANQI